MPTILEKKAGSRTCADCGATVGADATSCSKCGSEDIRKSFVLVRKAVADKDEDLDESVVDNSEDDDEEDDDDDDDLEEDDFEAADDDEDEDDSDDDDDSEDEKKTVALTDENKDVAKYEALNLTTALAEKVAKALSDPDTARETYEEVMTEFNAVFDGAAEKWFAGQTVTKSKNVKELKETVTKRLVEGTVAKSKVTRPDALDKLELPDEVKAYIDSLEGSDGVEVEKSEDIYKGLTPEVAEIVRKAAETNERNESDKWLTIAKGYRHYPGDKEELAKSLRTLSETSPAAFERVKSTLDAGEKLLAESNVFKSFGTVAADTDGGDEVSKRRSQAQKLVDAGGFKSLAQAEEHLLNQKYAGQQQ